MLHYPNIKEELRKTPAGISLKALIDDCTESFSEWLEGVMGEDPRVELFHSLMMEENYGGMEGVLSQILDSDPDVTEEEFDSMDSMRLLLGLAEECSEYGVFSEDKEVILAATDKEACATIIAHELDMGLLQIPDHLQTCIDNAAAWRSHYRHFWSAMEWQGVRFYYPD